MVSLLIDSKFYEKNLEQIKKDFPKTKIIETKFSNLEELNPIVLRIPNGTFYKNVPYNRIVDVIAGRGNDIKIQTARLFNIEMKKYMSEQVYRKHVKVFMNELLKHDDFNREVIREIITNYIAKMDITYNELVNPLMMALIGTTKGPQIADLLLAFGKEDAITQIKNYLDKYKHRI